MTLGRGAGLDESGRRRRVVRSPPVSLEAPEWPGLVTQYGEDVAEGIWERAAIIWSDRVPWDRALAQAEAMHRRQTA